MAVFPPSESETDRPCSTNVPMAPVPTNFACWVHPFSERVYTHVAPVKSLSSEPPTIAVFPSPESETEVPCAAKPMMPVPTSFTCWVHRLPERVYTHAAPARMLS
jgi:hypothetical protein